jgi:hypothetical protein
MAGEADAARCLREAQLWLRQLNEGEAFEEWEAMNNDLKKLPTEMPIVANPFLKRRTDVYPFKQRAEWAALTLTTTVV